MQIRLRVRGTPAPKGSMKCIGRPGGGHRLIPDDKGKKLGPWVERVTATARAATDRHGPVEGPLGAQVTFFLARPSTVRRALPWARGADVDKLARAVLDALQAGGIITDDAQVVDLALSKRYATTLEPEGAVIILWPVEEDGA